MILEGNFPEFKTIKVSVTVFYAGAYFQLNSDKAELEKNCMMDHHWWTPNEGDLTQFEVFLKVKKKNTKHALLSLLNTKLALPFGFPL